MSTPVDFPVCLRLEGKRVLLVGAGKIADERGQQLVDAGARVRLVAPEVSPRLRQLADAGRLELRERRWSPEDLDAQHLVFVATDDTEVSHRVAAEARARGLWVNTADVPDLCDFTLPSVGRRGPLVVAVSSSGQAPALARLLRERFVAQVEPGHVQLARLSGWLRKRLPRGAARMRLLKQLVEGEAGVLWLRGERRAAWAQVRAAIAEHWGETT
ncbi:precorrin-2 dehydrogenase/sirohydrochlorin ferrochelatase family protein [Archangium primigenium]|uniref:precorrin-2 dehydrogenase/sirohydrochlorin ferrochelatase family protein n=1 Tax=[Archangium] primigenium TaxID=2792470 RepID=UPI001958D20B|nr:bifunctional precorrin-2 dehydrogenase/sirohydrochlorin ferrochelatase [Archangium primigenium]MBM7115493.1 bifunctional precorrin-2 dehydrogenase/sirohydrochlorin ferrochelatase [Archangium primigenium]